MASSGIRVIISVLCAELPSSSTETSASGMPSSSTELSLAEVARGPGKYTCER